MYNYIAVGLFFSSDFHSFKQRLFQEDLRPGDKKAKHVVHKHSETILLISK